MGISIRKKENADKTTSIYLDIYHNGRRKYEFLQQLKLHTKPSNPLQRAENKENLEIVDSDSEHENFKSGDEIKENIS